MDRLFTRLGAEFGHKFISTIPSAEAEEATKAIWAERLSGLSYNEIRYGVDQLSAYAERNNGWPPGAAEFRELCRRRRQPYERENLQDCVLYHDEDRSLEQKPASRGFAQQHIDALRNRMQAGGE